MNRGDVNDSGRTRLARDSRPAPERAQPPRRVRRLHSTELLHPGEDLIIEHGGRDYRLRVTNNGKLILTA